MHRPRVHVIAFLLIELGASGSLDDKHRLHDDKFPFIDEYVICIGCKSSDTVLKRDNHLLFLISEKCCSSRSVAQIKAGFVARVGRRNAGT
ncbi:hypothetical protein L1987_84171 [Smallanthus sonchifolius]|uniref:Uncharacterized protein n=1 Tax=Smallanthus sonchifolius TaxID=185202 RepID=A0ACB8YFF7_9ASTR|nr:hypothetical protein L1987_84171 [Smallanthus sonchifolius]